MKVVVIGGVAAGMSAASKLKREDNNAEIVVYEKGVHLSYGACGLPYYVGDLNDDYKKLILRTKEDFEKKGIKVNLKHEVTGVDPEKNSVKVKNLENGEEFEDDKSYMLGTVDMYTFGRYFPTEFSCSIDS